MVDAETLRWHVLPRPLVFSMTTLYVPTNVAVPHKSNGGHAAPP